MIIKTFTAGPLETHCYLVACPHTKEAALIDAPPGVSDQLMQEKEFLVKRIFITHSHWDHFADAAQLKKIFKVPLCVHPDDEENLKHPGSDQLPLFFPIEPVQAEGHLQEGSVWRVGNLELRVLETPGHSPGSVCLWFPKEKVLFSGDTLFKGSMGRVDFPTSKSAHMWESLRKLGKLPADTQIYPGHGPPTTVGAEGWIKTFGG